MAEKPKISIRLENLKRKEAPRPSLFDVDEGADAALEPPPAKIQKRTDEHNILESRKLQDIGNKLAEEGKFSWAVYKFDEAIQLTPQNAVLWELKAQAFMELDQFFSAIEAAERATKLSPKWPDGFLTLARAQINFGELDVALETLKYAITLPVTDQEVKDSIGTEFQRALHLVEQRKKLEEVSLGGRVVRGHFISKEELDSLREAKKGDSHSITALLPK